VLQRTADLRVKDSWPDYLDWMLQATIKMRRVFAPRVKALQLEIPAPTEGADA
jgi:hypothetical protein